MRMRSGVCAVGILATIIAIAGCAAAAAPTATPTAPPTPSPAGTSAPATALTPAPTATQADGSESIGRTTFSGTGDCGLPDGLEEATEGQITTYTGRIACTVTTSDPRATGELSGEITMVYLDKPGFEVNKWWASEPWTVTTPGGSWVSTEAFGADVWDAKDFMRTTGTDGYVGQDGYAGLRMRWLYAAGTNEHVDAYIIVGWIEPAE